MIIRKITEGCVVQIFDTDKGKYIHQDFIPSGKSKYELEDGTPCLPITIKKLDGKFLPFDMKQPKK